MMTAGTVPILVAGTLLPDLVRRRAGERGAAWSPFYVAVILYVFAQRAANNLDPVYEDSARTLGGDSRATWCATS